MQLYRCGFEKVPENISALSKLDTLLMEGFRSGLNLLHAIIANSAPAQADKLGPGIMG